MTTDRARWEGREKSPELKKHNFLHMTPVHYSNVKLHAGEERGEYIRSFHLPFCKARTARARAIGL